MLIKNKSVKLPDVCPRCRNGILRVIPGVSCLCSNSSIVCDFCQHKFRINYKPGETHAMVPHPEQLGQFMECIGLFWTDDFFNRRNTQIDEGQKMEPLVSIRDYVSLHDLRLAIEGEKSAILVDMLWFIENRLGHQNSLTDTEMFKLVVSRSILRKNQHSNLQMRK